MSSIWFVDFNLDEGFHVTKEDALRRAAELESLAGEVRSRPASIVEVEDVKYEIHRDGSVPDSVWLVLEDGSIVDDCGYSVTRASARGDLEDRDTAGFEAWECSDEREQGMRLADYLQNVWGTCEMVRVRRHDTTGEQGQPSVAAVRAKDLIRHDTDLPEPMTSVRGDLTTYTWAPSDDTVVEVRVNGGAWDSLVVHKPNARPMVWTQSEEIIHSARWAMGVQERVDLRLYAGPESDFLLNLDQDL
ncbi:hypothetical protein [Janibacter limosus]|uniref:hypothetical protein n=1 Tax=Janibacter limosus TaxID=53458 RepID=UPI00082C321D|nr:hypothetical protein [Janibacter limosus]